MSRPMPEAPAAAVEITAIGVMARAPVPGRCKTRLIPRLGAAGAAALHARLIETTLATARAASMPVTLFTTGATTDWPRGAQGVPQWPQIDGDLGARMAAALAHLLARHPRALLVGCDCPALHPAHLQAAAAALAAARLVFIPAEDGGYVLVGARRPLHPAPFGDLPWGSAAVMAETRARLQAAGARAGADWVELPPLWDLDRPADLDRAIAAGLLPTRPGIHLLPSPD